MQVWQRHRKIMLRRAQAAAIAAGRDCAFEQLERICHPAAVTWANGKAAKQQALVETCVSLPTHMWSCASLVERAQRTYEIRRKEDAAADRHVRALLAHCAHCGD